jgi:hypothetical protein
VLGSEELYREWGYTAMSRHANRHGSTSPAPTCTTTPSSAAGRPARRRDRPPDQAHPRQDAGARSPPLAEREQLERERQQLHEQLKPERPIDREPWEEQRDLDARAPRSTTRATARRCSSSTAPRCPGTAQGRQQLDKYLAANHAEQQRLESGLSETIARSPTPTGPTTTG